MIEEGVLKNSIKVSDLLNANVLMAFAGNQFKIAIADSQGSLSYLQEWTKMEVESISDLLSIKLSDLASCKTINVLTHHETYSLVPDELYEQENKKDYLAQLCLIDNALPVFSDYISSLDSYIIYQASSEVVKFLKECPDQTRLHHHAGIFIQYQQKKNAINGDEVLLHFEENCFNCIVFRAGQLIYSNNQRFESAADAIYFILGIFESLSILSSEQEVILSGRIMPYSELYNTIMRFIKNVAWFQVPSTIINDKLNESTSPHIYTDLIRLSACVL